MKPMFLVQGPVATRSGYGEHARDLIRALISIDKWDVKVINTRWGNTPMNALNEKNSKDKWKEALKSSFIKINSFNIICKIESSI